LELQPELAQQVELLGLEQLEFELSLLQHESNGLLHKPEVSPIRQLTGEMSENRFAHLAMQLACGKLVGDQ
jgi:hypothetical protein